MELFKRKTEDQLKALTHKRIKAYWRAEKNGCDSAMPWCCEFKCDLHWESKEQEQEIEEWNKYLGYIFAIMKTKETI